MTKRRRHRRHTRLRATGPMLLHVFSFAFAREEHFTRAHTVLIRSRHGHTDLIGQAYDEAHTRGPHPFLVDIKTVPIPRATPRLDKLCRQHTASPTFLALLTAPAGYRPSIRLDLTGPEGSTLAAAYDAWQTRWGDPRRALVWPCQASKARHA